ncbi:hypothetical protein O0L34_g7367 [Tuta absoluta]|nr:hypothetical protein O0L34_g7367 [Tuta absoluta]
MSESHDGAESVKKDKKGEEDGEVEKLEVTNELSAKVVDSAIKEANSDKDEKREIYGADAANASSKGDLKWTLEGDKFKVSWSLPEEVATPKDYIALCCKGMFVLCLSQTHILDI